MAAAKSVLGAARMPRQSQKVQFRQRLRASTGNDEVDYTSRIASRRTRSGGRFAKELLNKVPPSVQDRHAKLTALRTRWERDTSSYSVSRKSTTGSIARAARGV